MFCLTYHTFTSDEEILEFVKGELNIERPPEMEDQVLTLFSFPLFPSFLISKKKNRNFLLAYLIL